MDVNREVALQHLCMMGALETANRNLGESVIFTFIYLVTVFRSFNIM